MQWKQELWAGTYLYEAAQLLESVGMAFENMGDVEEQTIAGAISTGTHGTGINTRFVIRSNRCLDLGGWEREC